MTGVAYNFKSLDICRGMIQKTPMHAVSTVQKLMRHSVESFAYIVKDYVCARWCKIMHEENA